MYIVEPVAQFPAFQNAQFGVVSVRTEANKTGSLLLSSEDVSLPHFHSER